MIVRFVHDDLRQNSGQVIQHSDLEVETQFTQPSLTAFVGGLHDAH